jgi:hypothetical protein
MVAQSVQWSKGFTEGLRSPANASVYSVLLSDQTASGAHPAPYTTGTRRSGPQVKCLGHEFGHWPQFNGQVKSDGTNKHVHLHGQMLNYVSFEVFTSVLHRVALVRKYVSKERSASIIRVTIIGELRTVLALTSNRSTPNIPEDDILNA